MGILKKIFGKKDTTTNTQVKVDPNLNSQITPYLKPEAIATPIEGTKPYVPPSPTPTPQPRGGGGSSTYIPPTTFTGKVDVKGSGGQVEETRFESGGKEVGKISYGETKRGRNTGKERFISGEPTVTTAKGVKSASFTFDTEGGTKRQVVDLGGDTGGARISEYEMIIGETRPGIQEDVLVGGGDILGGFDLGSQQQYGGTRTDMGNQFVIPNMQPVYSPGTIYSVPTGSKYGIQTFTVGDDWSSRTATREEILTLSPLEVRPATKEEIKGFTLLGKTKAKVNEFSYGEWGAGTYFEKELSEFASKGGKFRQVSVGTIAGIIPTTKGELIKTGVEFGIGAGIGLGVKGAGILLENIPKVGKYIAPTFKIGALGGGAYLTGAYALGKIGMVSATPDYYSKGQIIGGSIREFGVMGLGYGVGSKGAEKLYGLYKTRGREELPLSNMLRESVISGKESFPTAPPETHLKLFKGTVEKIPELTEGTPGGFHVTPEKFFGKNKDITPQAGTSELPGLYVSSEPSIHFAKLGGSGYSLFKLPTLKSILGSDNPAIAFLKPKGFRESGFQKVPTYKVGEQEFKFDFKQPAKEGFIDVPKMKTEIEGIARTDAGSYGYESGKYYTTIEGVRVPIDVFGAKGGKVQVRIEGGKQGKGFSSQDYSYLPEKTSLTNIRSSLGRIGSSYKGYSNLSSSYLPTSSSISSSLSKGSSSYINKMSSGLSSYNRKSYRDYFGSSSKGGGSSSSNLSSYIPYSPSKKPPIFKLPKMYMKESQGIIRGERLFLPTTSFGVSLGKQLGINIGGVSQKGKLAQTGLVERKYGTTKLPTTVLLRTQKKEFTTFPKIKSYVRSVI